MRKACDSARIGTGRANDRLARDEFPAHAGPCRPLHLGGGGVCPSGPDCGPRRCRVAGRHSLPAGLPVTICGCKSRPTCSARPRRLPSVPTDSLGAAMLAEASLGGGDVRRSPGAGADEAVAPPRSGSPSIVCSVAIRHGKDCPNPSGVHRHESVRKPSPSPVIRGKPSAWSTST